MNAFMRGSMRVLGLVVVAGMMAACEKTMIGEEMEALRDVNGAATTPDANGKTAALQVMTRSGDSEATIGYPVHVYVFQDNECRALQTIASADDELDIALVEGTYFISAIGGAAAEDYNLPTMADASPSTALTLKEGKGLTDLMAASAEVTLVDGGTNVVTLALQRKVMLLQTLTIRQVPTAATAVTVTIAPLSENLKIGGGYNGENGSMTVSLTRQSDGRTWTMDTAPTNSEAGVFLLPPSGSEARISVVITMDAGTKSYSYVTDELAANHKISIDGTYAEAVGVTLTGTIAGVAWLDDRTISFDLNDNPSGGGENPSDLPAAGDTYQRCYVLASNVAANGQSAELTLLSPNEGKLTNNASMTLSTLEDYATARGTEGISGWRPMTRSEAQLLQAAHTALGIADDRYYLFDDDGTVKQMRMSNGTVSTPTASAAYIRPVATVTVTNN